MIKTSLSSFQSEGTSMNKESVYPFHSLSVSFLTHIPRPLCLRWNVNGRIRVTFYLRTQKHRQTHLYYTSKELFSYVSAGNSNLLCFANLFTARVKAFNMRFRSRHFAGDAAVACSFSDNIQSPDPVDPRGSPAFVELDNIISSFKSSFPPHLKTPIHDNIVDSHLYTAFLMPHVCVLTGKLSQLLFLTINFSATVVLHDPHAEVQQSGCISALKILTAARGILDLIYSICSTSYDITLLDSFCSVSLPYGSLTMC